MCCLQHGRIVLRANKYTDRPDAAQSQNAEVGVQHEAEAEIIMAKQFTVKINLYTLLGYLYLQYVLYLLIGQMFLYSAVQKNCCQRSQVAPLSPSKHRL